MVITWYGHACFKIQSGETVLVVDPFAKETGLTPPRFRADIVLVTHAHYDHSNTETLAGGPFIIAGPGEYEVKGVNIRGIETFHDASSGSARGKNTVYVIEMEGIRILHMGDFGEAEAREATLESIGEVDVVMVPVGGTYTVEGRAAAKIIRQIEPSYVIPMHYKLPGLKIALEGPEVFLKEMGAANAAPMDKFAIKAKEIVEDKKTQVIFLQTA